MDHLAEWVGHMHYPSRKVTDLPEFAPSRAHLLLTGVHGYLPHHNNEVQVEREIPYNAVWQHHWHQLNV